MLSIIIPLRDEFDNLEKVRDKFNEKLSDINHEVLLINDFSKDNTLDRAKEISKNNKNFKVFENDKKGLGGALNLGIEKSAGDYICIMMADLSDDIDDLKRYNELIEQGYNPNRLRVRTLLNE
mgnify:CR=1 FL=1